MYVCLYVYIHTYSIALAAAQVCFEPTIMDLPRQYANAEKTCPDNPEAPIFPRSAGFRVKGLLSWGGFLIK